jgi:hypothetical protein
MKTILVSLAAGALVLTGCSSAYRTAEMPDDVYYSYSPNRPAVEDRFGSRDEEYVSYWDDNDDRYLRMKVRNRRRWSQLDDLAYWNGGMNMSLSWGIGFNPWNNWNTWNAWNTPFGWNNWTTWSTWNTPWAWGWNGWGGVWNHPFAFNQFNSWNNPWCWSRPVVFVNKYPTRPVAYTPRPGFNRGGFNNTMFDRGNGNGNRTMSKPAYQQPGYGNGSLFRTIFSGSSNNASSNNSSWTRPARFFDGGSSSSGSMNSGGSSRTSGSSSSGSSGSSSSSSSGGGGRGGRGGN